MNLLVKHIAKLLPLDLNSIELRNIRKKTLNRLGNPKTKKCSYCEKEKDIKEFGLVGLSYKTPSLNSKCEDCSDLFYRANLLKAQYPDMTIKEIIDNTEMMELKKSQLLNYKLKKIIKNGTK